MKQQITQRLTSFFRYKLRQDNMKKVEAILRIVTLNSIPKQKKPAKIQSIAFVMPKYSPFSGGTNSIIRIGSFFAQQGVSVSYLVYDKITTKEIKKLSLLATKCLPSFQGEFKDYSSEKNTEFNVCIATSWQSVYYAKKLQGYKVYFVQDFEPFFYPMGEEYLLSCRTYCLGFHIISLGDWNLKMIRKNCGQITSPMDSITFPYEPREYPFVQRNYNYSAKKKISLAVYIKFEGKRLPYLISYMLCKARESLLEEKIELDISFYGLNRHEKILVGKNVGRLDKKSLLQLYMQSDFGMVASMTNISLVPYEMIATGLPVIEFSEGSYSDFLGDDTAILVDYDYHDLCNKLKYYINNSDKLSEMQEKAHKATKGRTWENTCKEFANLLLDCDF